MASLDTAKTNCTSLQLFTELPAQGFSGMNKHPSRSMVPYKLFINTSNKYSPTGNTQHYKGTAISLLLTRSGNSKCRVRLSPSTRRHGTVYTTSFFVTVHRIYFNMCWLQLLTKPIHTDTCSLVRLGLFAVFKDRQGSYGLREF